MRNKRISQYLCLLSLLSLLILSHVQADMWVSRPIEGLVGDTFEKPGYRIVPGDDPRKRKYRIHVEKSEAPKGKATVDRYGRVKKEDPMKEIKKLPPPTVGGSMVGDFFGHEESYLPLRADPDFCSIVYQYIRMGQGAGLADADMAHQIAIRGMSSMKMMVAFVGNSGGQANNLLKIYDELIKRKRGKLKFLKWMQSEEEAVAANSIEEGLASKFDSIVLETFTKIVNEHRDVMGTEEDLAQALETFAKRKNALNQNQIAAEIAAINKMRVALKKPKALANKHLQNIIDISNDSNRSLLVRVQAGMAMKEISPEECLRWCVQFFESKTEILAYHACWLARAYGGPPARVLDKMKHKAAAFKHIAWAAILKGDPKYIKKVLSIPGKDPNTKVYKNALNAALGKAADIKKVIKYIARIQDKVNTGTIEGDLNVYGPVPLVFLIQSLAQIPSPKDRLKTFDTVFNAGRTYPDIIAGKNKKKKAPMAPDGVLVSYYCYMLYKHVTKEEQEQLKKWKKRPHNFPLQLQVLDAVVAKEIEKEKKKK